MNRLPRQGAGVRTPSSAMLVQMLFVMGAIGTGAVGALVSWLGPRAEKPAPKAPNTEKSDEE